MTVDDLRKKLNGVDGSLEVVVRGHFGEGIRVSSYGWEEENNVNVVNSSWDWRDNGTVKRVFQIPYTHIGEDPT